MNLLLSSYITGESRIMIRRDIQERVGTIAPFLRLDHDPYLVISGGRLFWMQDAYTTSDYFPYAQPAQGLDLNYIRNSVKVVVDAYNGTVDFYLMDFMDPIAATYRRIFPGLIQAVRGHAGGSAEAYSLSGGPIPHFRRSSIKPTTWRWPTFSITARISGNSRASRAAAAPP